jgi:hypothetical protein
MNDILGVLQIMQNYFTLTIFFFYFTLNYFNFFFLNYCRAFNTDIHLQFVTILKEKFIIMNINIIFK